MADTLPSPGRVRQPGKARHHHAAAHTDRGENHDPTGTLITAQALNGGLDRPSRNKRTVPVRLPRARRAASTRPSWSPGAAVLGDLMAALPIGFERHGRRSSTIEGLPPSKAYPRSSSRAIRATTWQRRRFAVAE